jgi:hypothetical protein
MAKKEFNRYKEVWDESGKMLKDPAGYLNENHTHNIDDVIGLEEKLTGYDENITRVDNHIKNNDVHVSEEDRKKWNAGGVIVDSELNGNSTNPVQNKAISKELALKVNETDFKKHIDDISVHISEEDRKKWNEKSDVIVDDEVTALSENPVSSMGISKALDRKANTTDLDTKISTEEFELHKADTTSHVTSEERAKWNAKSDVVIDGSLDSTSENAITNKAVSVALNKKADASDLADKIDTNTFTDHVTNTLLHVSSAEKEKWNKILEDAKAYVDSKYSSIDKIDFYVIEDGKSHTDIETPSIEYIYLEKGETGTQYQSWIYRDGGWKNTGADDLKLDNYYNKTETYAKNEVYSKEESYNKNEVDAKFDSFNPVVSVDEALSSTSKNPVQNKVINEALKNKALKTDLDKKADKTSLESHVGDNIVHITADERTKWNIKTTPDGTLNATSTNSVQNKAVTKEFSNYVKNTKFELHANNNDIHVTAEEKKKWNSNSGGGISDVSKKDGNIITTEADGIYAPKTDLTKYPTKEEIRNMVSTEIAVDQIKGKKSDYLHARMDYSETLTVSSDFSSPDLTNPVIVPMKKVINGNNINVSTSGKITLNPNKTYMYKISVRIANGPSDSTSPCIGVQLYDETDKSLKSEADEFKYSQKATLNYSNGESIGIIKTDEKEHVVYPIVTEAYNTPKLNGRSNITIIEIGANVNVNNQLDIIQKVNSDVCYFYGCHPLNENETSSGYNVTYYTKAGIDQKLPMNRHVDANGISINSDNEIVLPANKKFLVMFNARFAVTESYNFAAFSIYNKTDNVPMYQVINNIYQNYSSKTWSSSSHPGIIKTTKETVIYPFISEFSGTKIGLQQQTNILIIEIGSNITINNSYAGFNETVLFEGKANTKGSFYNLTDSIDNYDLIRVEYKDFTEPRPITTYETFNPKDITTNAISMQAGNWSKSTYNCQTILWFNTRNSFGIFYTTNTSSNYYDFYITKITGIKGGASV